MGQLSASVQSEVESLVGGNGGLLAEVDALRQQTARLGERVVEAEGATLNQVRWPLPTPQ